MRKARVKAAREKCALEANDIRADEEEQIRLAKAEEAQERLFRRQLVGGDKALRKQRRAKRKHVPAAVRQREQRQESDEFALANIPQALHPLWEQVKGRIRSQPGRRRDEAFLEYAHEHPDEVLEAQMAALPSDDDYAAAQAAWYRDHTAAHAEEIPF